MIPLWILIAVTVIPGASETHAAEPGRPLLVTVDDLPMSGGDLHDDPAGRRRTTEGMLEVLARHGIRAVGMVTWGNLRFPEDRKLLEMWLEAGHELGNHSYRHRSAAALTAGEFIDDAEKARVEIAALLEAHGRTLRFFRFPMLREGDTLEKLRAIRGYLDRTAQRNLPVTLDNQDWSFERPWVEASRRGDEAAMRRIAEEYHAALRVAVGHHERLGDSLYERKLPQILLLHGGAVGAAQWDALFTWLKGSGHRFATADEVMADPVFAEPVEYVGTHGPGLWERVADQRRRVAAEKGLRETIETQVAAWNLGDLETFCSVYAEDAAFVAPSGLTRGRAAVLERYRARYPDRRAMGKLEIAVEEVRLASGTEVSMLGDATPGRIHQATVVARWTLRFEDKDPATGLTLLVMRPRDDGWEIVQDASM